MPYKLLRCSRLKAQLQLAGINLVESSDDTLAAQSVQADDGSRPSQCDRL
jgi:hypothetical protein